MPLKPQLIKLINSEIYTKFRQSSENESDIISGSHYCNLKQNGIIGENDITLQWNTGGVKLFISSKYSFWGIQVLINELLYRDRKSQIILCGIWCNFSKPPMNMFLKPFCDKLVELSEKGFSLSTYISQELVHIKVHVIAGIMFNGKYGCTYCLHKDLRIPVGKGHVRVYCGYKRRDRNIEEHMKFAKEAFRTNKKVKGVKNNSIMMILPNHNIILDYLPEYMHNCLLGISKLFATEWLVKNNEKVW